MIELRLLGSLDLEGSDGTLRSVLAQPKRVALLAYLAVARPNGFHRRDKLLGLFWPERDQERGRGALRKAVYWLRQSLGEEMIVGRGDEEVGLAEGALWCDAVAFEEALDADEPERALELYGGDLLEGFYIAEAPEFERWLEVERERLRRRASEAAWTLAEREEADGSSVHAASWAKKAVNFSPDDEGGFRRLLEFLDRVGDRAGAMKEYEAFTRRLSEEYEGEPSPETQALIAAIRERDVSAVGGTAERPVENPAGVQRAPAPEPAPVRLRSEPDTEPHPISLLRVLSAYTLVSLAVLVAVHIFTLQLGLPDWFFPGAVVVLLVCFPIIVATALVQGSVVTARRADAEVEAPSATARRWLSWRNAVGVTVAAFALLGLAVTGYMALRVMGIGPWGTLIGKGVLEERDLIVLADFEDHTGDSTLALTVTEAFRVDLGQSPVVRVADRDYVSGVLERMEKEPDLALTYDLAREVAIREGLKAVVTGEINRAGSGFVLSARLVAAETGEDLYSARETAKGLDPIVPAIDRLSARVRERIGESVSTVRNSPPLAQVRTASLEALRIYTEAAREESRADFERALDLLSRAIEIDTAFAGAYGMRAIVVASMGMQTAQSIADAKRAYELRDRLPLRERYLYEAWYHRVVTRDFEAQANARRALVDLEPENPSWWHNLGMAYVVREDARAEEMFRRAIEMDSLHVLAWIMLVRTQINLGRYDEAEETLRRAEHKVPEARPLPLGRAVLAFRRGDYGAAEVHLRDWGDGYGASLWYQGRTSRYLARLAQVQGKLAEAESHLREAMAAFERGDHSVDYLRTGFELGFVQAWFGGDTARALETATATLERHRLDSIELIRRPYGLLANFNAFAGAPQQARALLEEYETVILPVVGRTLEQSNPREMAVRRAWGVVALAEGRPEEALKEFRAVREISRRSTAGATLLGYAHELAGQPDSAIVMYEQYLTLPYWGLALEGDSPFAGCDPYWLPVIYERLGGLYEQRADTAKAIYYYGKFIDLWKDADPELQPRVEVARRAIETLSPDR